MSMWELQVFPKLSQKTLEDQTQQQEYVIKLICPISRYVEPAALGATSFFEVSWEFEEIAGTGIVSTVPKAVALNSKEISATKPNQLLVQNSCELSSLCIQSN